MARPRVNRDALPAIGRWLGQFAMFSTIWLILFAVAPMAWGWQPRSIISGSMTPKIKVGDVVVIDPGAPTKLKAGQVISFVDPDNRQRVLTHRLVQENKDGTWQTKGDANPTPDSVPIHRSDIVGKPKILVPWVGMFAYWMFAGKPVYAIGTGVLLVVTVGFGASSFTAPPTSPSPAPTTTSPGRHRHRKTRRQRLKAMVRR